MTSQEYRERAEALLTSCYRNDLSPRLVEQAAVWAQLATAAAIVEAAQSAPPAIVTEVV